MAKRRPTRFRTLGRLVAIGFLAVLLFVAFAFTVSYFQFGPDPADWHRRRMVNISYGPPAYIHGFDVEDFPELPPLAHPVEFPERPVEIPR